MDPDWSELQSAIAGTVVLPDSPDYESVRKPFAALAVRVGLRTAISVQRALLRRSLVERRGVIDVTPMNAVSVAGDIATIGAGACLGDVYHSLSGMT
jgi:hypothetical protein